MGCFHFVVNYNLSSPFRSSLSLVNYQVKQKPQRSSFHFFSMCVFLFFSFFLMSSVSYVIAILEDFLSTTPIKYSVQRISFYLLFLHRSFSWLYSLSPTDLASLETKRYSVIQRNRSVRYQSIIYHEIFIPLMEIVFGNENDNIIR